MADSVLVHSGPILAGHAAGHYALPEAVTTAHTARERVAAALADVRGRQGHIALGMLVEAEAAAFVRLAAKNGPLPKSPGSAVVTAEAEDHELAASIRVATTALDLANGALARSIVEGIGTIVGNLDEAVADTLGIVRQLAPVFARGVPGADAVAFLPEDTGAAWHALAAATTRYQSIRDIARRLDRLAGGTDLGGAFAEFADPDADAIWGGRLGGMGLSTWRPWPEEPMARLLWLAALPEGSVRVLSVAEQNRRAVERQKRSTIRRPGDALGATTAA